jgi:hypothetical protein
MPWLAGLAAATGLGTLGLVVGDDLGEGAFVAATRGASLGDALAAAAGGTVRGAGLAVAVRGLGRPPTERGLGRSVAGLAAGAGLALGVGLS